MATRRKTQVDAFLPQTSEEKRLWKLFHGEGVRPAFAQAVLLQGMLGSTREALLLVLSSAARSREGSIEFPPDLLEKLRDDFNFATEKLCDFYHILQKNPEGRLQYTSSYSETAGEVFVMKTFEEVMAGFDEQDKANIQAMIECGEEPMLVPVPLDDLGVMADKLDFKKTDLFIKISDTVIDDDLKSPAVKYYPDDFKTEGVGDDIKLKSFGGISKTELIRKTGGFDYGVMPTKQNLDGDNTVIYTRKKKKVRRLAGQQKLLFDKQKAGGVSGITPETNLIIQALLLSKDPAGGQKPLASHTFELLAGVALPDVSKLAKGDWNGNRVCLICDNSNDQSGFGRVRGWARAFKKA